MNWALVSKHVTIWMTFANWFVVNGCMIWTLDFKSKVVHRASSVHIYTRCTGRCPSRYLMYKLTIQCSCMYVCCVRILNWWLKIQFIIVIVVMATLYTKAWEDVLPCRDPRQPKHDISSVVSTQTGTIKIWRNKMSFCNLHSAQLHTYRSQAAAPDAKQQTTANVLHLQRNVLPFILFNERVRQDNFEKFN